MKKDSATESKLVNVHYINPAMNTDVYGQWLPRQGATGCKYWKDNGDEMLKG
jgi:hypothetical protein